MATSNTNPRTHRSILIDAPLSPRTLLRRRLQAAAVFSISFGLLLTASFLTPSASGTGTHRQLGLPPCGFKAATRMPCATCGMTTSFSHATNGDLPAAFATQPAGAMLAVASAVMAIISGYAVCSGMALGGLFAALFRPRIVIVGMAIVLAAWAYTITRQILYPPPL